MQDSKLCSETCQKLQEWLGQHFLTWKLTTQKGLHLLGNCNFCSRRPVLCDLYLLLGITGHWIQGKIWVWVLLRIFLLPPQLLAHRRQPCVSGNRDLELNFSDRLKLDYFRRVAPCWAERSTYGLQAQVSRRGAWWMYAMPCICWLSSLLRIFLWQHWRLPSKFLILPTLLETSLSTALLTRIDSVNKSNRLIKANIVQTDEY